MLSRFVLLLSVILIYGCKSKPPMLSITSPDKGLSLTIDSIANGQWKYAVTKNGKPIIKPSDLGLIAQEANLSQDLSLVNTSTSQFNSTWQTVWGQNSSIKNNYNGLDVIVQNTTGCQLKIQFKLYNDGLGFRYKVEQCNGQDSLHITDELTTFNLTGDHTTWWVPGCWDNDEYPYTKSKLSEVDASFYQKGYKYSNVTTITNKYSVNTPVTMKSMDNYYLSIHEAALVDFPGMSLLVDTSAHSLKSHLAESDNAKGVKAVVTLPMKTPWRTVMINSEAKGLLANNLILNLNEPCVLSDVSWIKPTKYMGIWWEMHVGKAAWDIASGKHGATTQNAKYYIDFCAKNNIPALLIEGWNKGWEQWVGDDREGIFDFVTPYSDFDIKEVVAYAKSKGVQIIGHHETASAVETYEAQMDTAYQFYAELGVPAVKTGYVGKIPGHRHYDQRMVNHYNKTMTETAKYKIMLNIHEPVKPTGLTRTYPHLMSGEGMRGQEFNAWSDGNKPMHNVTLPFTRNLAGPMDFTPGIFDLKLEKYKNNVTKVSSFDDRAGEKKPYSRVFSTLAHQLALYVVFYSPVQMAADLPENYEGHPAFQFIRDVGVDWDETRIIDAELGEYVVTMRKEKGKEKWFVGGITGDKQRIQTISFDLLPKGKKYKAIIYKDAADADYLTNPGKYTIETREVDSSTSITLDMKAAGGFAISIW